MENDDCSIVVALTRRKKCFRKLRWKNYLNHLLNLWLFCVNVSADGRSYVGNESAFVNLRNESNSTIISETSFLRQHSNRSLKPSYAIENENRKMFNKTPEFSDFNRTASRSVLSLDDNAVASNFDASNKSSLSEKVFRLIKSKPEQKGSSQSPINQSISSDHSSIEADLNGPQRHNKPENIVNITRITNDALANINNFHRVKKSENGTSKGENKLSIHYNQSSLQPEATQNNQSLKKVKKKLKSGTKTPAGNRKYDAKKLSKVSLLGLFEMTTHLGVRWEGKSELAAAELAVKHINERGLLPGYTLELITNDTQVTRVKVSEKK